MKIHKRLNSPWLQIQILGETHLSRLSEMKLAKVQLMFTWQLGALGSNADAGGSGQAGTVIIPVSAISNNWIFFFCLFVSLLVLNQIIGIDAIIYNSVNQYKQEYILYSSNKRYACGVLLTGFEQTHLSGILL